MPVGEVSDEDAKNFLTDLAVKGQVVASTQNQAFNALLFFFRHVLKRDYDLKDRVVRAKQTKYIPTVLTGSELDAVLGELRFPYHLIVSMLYGCGLRLSECLELRINSLDFSENLVIVHDGKGKNLGSAIALAVRKAKVPKRVTAHTFRHTFASHLLAANVDLRTIQQLLGHTDIRTTMIYTHTVTSRTRKEMISPLDL